MKGTCCAGRWPRCAVLEAVMDLMSTPAPARRAPCPQPARDGPTGPAARVDGRVARVHRHDAPASERLTQRTQRRAKRTQKERLIGWCLSWMAALRGHFVPTKLHQCVRRKGRQEERKGRKRIGGSVGAYPGWLRCAVTSSRRKCIRAIDAKDAKGAVDRLAPILDGCVARSLRPDETASERLTQRTLGRAQRRKRSG